jgi:3-oxoacyl-[acyl-carrier-protein] synthase-3
MLSLQLVRHIVYSVSSEAVEKDDVVMDDTQHMQHYAHITGWGMAVPDHVMHNDEFKTLVNVDHAWIYPRTGIKERRIAQTGETTTTLAVRAAQRALQRAGVVPGEIDLIIVATSTPEYIFPSTASIVQDQLGAIHAGGCDLAAACSGFVYALDMAVNKIRAGSIQTALVIGAETMSRVLDWTDRKTCVLFGDGAGALVLQSKPEPGGVLSSVLRSDGSGWDLLTLPTVNSQDTYLQDGIHQMHRIYMDGKCVFKFATTALVDGMRAALDAVHLTPADLDLLVAHQANQRILDQAGATLGLPGDKIFSNLDRFGNTSAASIPIALVEAVETGVLLPGALVGLVGFGGGLSWGAAVVQWGPAPHGAAVALKAGLRQQQYAWASVRRFWHKFYWRSMARNSPAAQWRRWRRKHRAHTAEPPREAQSAVGSS